MKTMVVPQDIKNRRLLAVLQHACHLVLILFLLLSLNGLSTQPAEAVIKRACNTFNSRNRSLTCECSGFSVRCVNVNPPLTDVPSDIMKTVRSLELNNNRIETIRSADFKGLENIQTLLLQDNMISDIHPDAFKNLFKLEILNLENNRLSELDPSGRTFQHLSSLHTLSLQNNNIRNINKYSFFTLTENGHTFSVNLDQNSIECDCDVLALRSWGRTIPAGKMEIENLICANDRQKRSYEVVEDSIFGSCNTTTASSFADTITCPICRNERTNHGCILQRGLTKCPVETVCGRSVEWGASDKAMMITSVCEAYQTCLTKETKNKQTCGIDYQTDKDVSCHFCCQGLTCTDDSLGGRTKDFTFSLSYIRSDANYESFMADNGDPRYLKEEERIDRGVRQAIHSLKGGLDVYLLQFIPQENQKYQVLLRLQVTVFNLDTEESVETAIKEDIKFSIQDSASFFFGENIIPVSLNMSSIIQGPNQCPESVSYSLDKGNITWKASPLGPHSEVCPYNREWIPESYASRTCLKRPDGSTEWGRVNYSSCDSKPKEENPDPENVFEIPLSSGNAQAVSSSLKTYIEQLDNFTVEVVNNVMNLLEQLLNDTMLEQPGVASNIVSSVSSLINIDPKELLELELKTSISKRLLAIIDYISEKAPLKDGKLMIVTPNIAIAAQGVNASETQDVVLTADSNSKEGLNNSQISVGFSNENSSQMTGRTSMVIPVQAIINSTTSEEKSNISRVAFAVHQSDKLFLAMRNTESREAQLVNTTENYFCEKNNSYDCPKTNSFITKINSRVISASVPGVIVQNISENITMSFAHNNENATNPRCVFWNKYLSNGTGEWSDEGCGVVVSYSGETTCGCNHLTNFALLMDVYQGGIYLSELDRKVLSIISYVGCGISFFALLLTILSYSVFRKLRRDNPSKILINLCVALMLTNLVYLVGMHDYTFDNTSSCKAVAVLLHYFLLASLTWMAVEAFYMYLALVRVFKAYFSNFILKCSLVGWGVPLVVVAITLGVNATDNYGFINSGLCWLKNPAFYAAFVGPVCFILLINCLAFGLVIRQLVSISSSELSKSDRNSTIQHLRAAVGVVILLGLTWLFAIFAIGQASLVFYYLFAVFNSFQGLFIFIYYCLLKKDAFAVWKRSLPCFEDPGDMSKTSSNSKAMTAVASNHHRVKHDNHTRSTSSTYLRSTVSGASTRTDSTYLNNVNSNNTYDSSEDCDTPIITQTVVDTSNYNKKTSPLLLTEELHSPISRTDELPSYNSSEYDTPSKDYNNTIEETQAETNYNNNIPDGINSTSSSLQRPITTVQYPIESVNYNLRQESPEKYQSYSSDEEEKGNPSILSPRAKEEIDFSSQAKVSDTRQKLDLSNSETTDKYITHL